MSRSTQAAFPGHGDPSADSGWVEAVRRVLLARAPQTDHLEEDVWLVLARGGVPDAGVTALAHLTRCAECREVLRAVRQLRADADAAGLASPPSRPAVSRVWGVAVWAAAAVLVLAMGGWLAWRTATPGTNDAAPGEARVHEPADAPAGIAASDERLAAPRPEWLRVEPPAVALYSPGVLAVRGTRTQSFPDAFGEAILPWQAGSYAEAATRFEALAAAYPDVAEAHFYQGSAWLLAGAPAESVAPLERSVSLAPASLYPEATWYLGMALLDMGRTDEAARAFADACGAGRPRACDAVRYVKSGGTETP